jgi:hypothetical protein
MQARKDNEARCPRSGGGGSRPPARGRTWSLSLRRGSLAMLLTLVLAAVLAPIGQARSDGEPSSEAQTIAATQRAAEREERAAAKQAKLEAERAAKQAQREAERAAKQGEAHTLAGERLQRSRSDERKNGVVTISCTQVSWELREFPEAPGNTVSEKVTVDGVSSATSFTFDGASGANVTPIDAPPGSYIIDAQARWRRASANGANGGFDIHAKITCAPDPRLSVEKLQRIEGSASGAYTSSPQTGEVGQTIGYEILVANPGNVPLTIGDFTDPRCDAGTITGGPAEGVLPPGGSSTYLCKHVLDEADLAVGSYENTAMLSGTPPEGDGATVTETSNTVLTEVRSHGSPSKQDEPTATPTSTSSGAPGGGALASSEPATGKSGVLAFSSARVPSLKGPQGCVRPSFRVSIASAGVASVVFYLDGHKLRRLTAHSARGGLLAVSIDAAKLKLGANRVLAKITMVKASASAKAVQASRSLNVLRCRAHLATPRFAG